MRNSPQLFASPVRADESVRVITVDETYVGCSWHFHPELQLCHVANGEGQRLIGDKLCPIEPGEVVLLGSNLPHVWRYEKNSRKHVKATVVHFDVLVLGSDWLERPELRHVRLLLTRASQGLQASGRLRSQLAEGIEEICRLDGLERIIQLLKLLGLMAESRELSTICSVSPQAIVTNVDVERLRVACDFINQNSHEELTRDAVAKLVHMSGSGFSRFFKSHTGMTFQEFVSDVRISRACNLLGTTQLSITDIALECGFRELSTFNRAFKKYREKTPSQYRSLVNSVANGSR